MTGSPRSSPYDIEVFFDGGCPVCRREIGLLQRWDRHQRILATDIDAPGFDPAAFGKTRDQLMARIHARRSDGTWIEGVEVFRWLYTAVGFGPLVALTRLPGISQMLDCGYAVFARYRPRLRGRCTEKTCAVARR